MTQIITPKTPWPAKAPSFTFMHESMSADTSAGMAQVIIRILAAMGMAVEHTPEKGWLLWDGNRWHDDAESDVVAVCHMIHARSIEQVAAIKERLREVVAKRVDDENDPALKETEAALKRERAVTEKIGGYFGMDGRIKGALNQLAYIVKNHLDAFDADKDLLGVANGVVDLRTGDLRPMTKEDRILRVLDTPYEPDAEAPMWEQFMREVIVEPDGTPDEEVIDYLQHMIGYGVTGHTREQCFLVLVSGGASGKSVFLDVLGTVFGAVHNTTPFETFEARGAGGVPNDVAMLVGARLVTASEGEQNAPMAEAKLKRFTGSDKMAARFMRQEFFEFEPQALLMMATNSKPQFKGQDEGLWRRVKLVMFNRYFEPHERDKTLADRLVAEEAAGILAWAVRGAMAWYALPKGLVDPEPIQRAVRQYRRDRDRLADFLDEELVEDADEAVKFKDVLGSYRDWWSESGEPGKPMSRQAFKEALRERGYEIEERSTRPGLKNQAAVVGVRLRRTGEPLPAKSDKSVHVFAVR